MDVHGNLLLDALVAPIQTQMSLVLHEQRPNGSHVGTTSAGLGIVNQSVYTIPASQCFLRSMPDQK